MNFSAVFLHDVVAFQTRQPCTPGSLRHTVCEARDLDLGGALTVLDGAAASLSRAPLARDRAATDTHHQFNIPPLEVGDVRRPLPPRGTHTPESTLRDHHRPQNCRLQPDDDDEDLAYSGMTGGQIVYEALLECGVEAVFGYSGGAVLPVLDQFHEGKINFVMNRSEQCCGHAAEGYARSSGKVGVIMVTSGPGLTNIITPLQDARGDSTPILALSGQVPKAAVGHRRVPGVPGGRPDAAVHQVVVPGEVGRGGALRRPRGLPRRIDGQARPRPPRPPEGRHDGGAQRREPAAAGEPARDCDRPPRRRARRSAAIRRQETDPLWGQGANEVRPPPAARRRPPAAARRRPPAR